MQMEKRIIDSGVYKDINKIKEDIKNAKDLGGHVIEIKNINENSAFCTSFKNNFP